MLVAVIAGGGRGGGMRLRDVGKKKKKRPWEEKDLFIIIIYNELCVKTLSGMLDLIELKPI